MVRYDKSPKAFSLPGASTKRQRMKGKLTDQPLAELIREISSKNLSAVAVNTTVRDGVYFEDGHSGMPLQMFARCEPALLTNRGL